MGGTTEFDPYHKWLGIPPTERPVNHYRLLGLALFEDDADVIAYAADRQMAHLKSFSAGPHASTSQQLLNELAEARLCLLSAEAKIAYDRQLRTTLSPVPKEMASSPVESTPQIPSIKVSAPPQSTSQRKGRRKVRVLTRLLNLAILVAMPAAVAYVLLVKFNPRYDFIGIFTPPAATAAKDPANSAQPSAQKTTPKQPAKPFTARELPAVVPATKKPLTTATSEKDLDNSAQRSEQKTAGESSTRKFADESPAQPFTDQDLPPLTSVTTNPLITLVNPNLPANRNIATNQNPTVEPELNLSPAGNRQPGTKFSDSQAPDLRHVVPAKEAQEKPLLLDPIYQARLELAQELPTPDKQAALKVLAKEIYSAHRGEEDPPTRFVLLENAIQIATESGDPTLTTQIIDDLAQQFKVDDLVLRATAAKAWSAQISKKYRGLEAQQMRGRLLPLILPLAQRAESEHRYALAAQLYELASKQATGDRDRQRELRKLVGLARSNAKRHDAIMNLVKELEVPGVDHSDQLLEIGRYWCFEQGDWEQGLRYFTASGSEQISKVARLDLDSQTNLKDAGSVGDRWWDLTPPPRFSKYKNHLKARAVYWYKLAVGDKQAFATARLEKRIEEAAHVLDESGMIREIASSLPASLRKGLVAYYPFNGNAEDGSGNGYHGEVNGPQETADRFGKTNAAYRFITKNDFIKVPEFSSNQITVNLWYTYLGNGGTWNTLLCRNGNLYHHLLIAPDNGEIGYFNSRWVGSGHKLEIDGTYCITLVKNGSDCMIYIDGMLVFQDVNSFENGVYPLAVIGNYGLLWNQGSLGILDDIRIYNRALSATEVKSLYDHEK
jgi:hypothetical protein